LPTYHPSVSIIVERWAACIGRRKREEGKKESGMSDGYVRIQPPQWIRLDKEWKTLWEVGKRNRGEIKKGEERYRKGGANFAPSYLCLPPSSFDLNLVLCLNI